MDQTNMVNICRICLNVQDTLFSLYRKRHGTSPYEKLISRTKLEIQLNDAGPPSICSQCLIDLDTTVSFLDKCERSNQLLGARFDEQNSNFRAESVEIESEPKPELQQKIQSQELIEEVVKEVKLSDVVLRGERCPECGSGRRCAHWAPAAVHCCPYCQKTFNKKYNYQIHIKRHLGESEFRCSICGAEYLSRWRAEHHCRARRRLPCPVPGCPKSFTTNTNLSTHIRKHSGERPFECDDCGKTFISKNILNNHMRIHTGAKPYMCQICGKQFATNKLSSHLASHGAAAGAGGGAGRHGCAWGGCARGFPSARALRSHARSHSPRRAFACAQCDHAYKFKQSLNHHVKNAHGVKAVRLPPLPAPFPRLPSARALRSHARSHSPRRAFACAQCDHAYKFKQSLNHHVKNAHGVKAVRLPPLPAPFPRLPSARALRSHARSHSPRRAFACAQCDHAYKFKQSLNHHVKNAHGVKAVRLPPLPAPFPRLPSARALRSHARSHSPRRAFACAQCDHAYKFKQSLNHHVKNAHGVKAVRLPPLPAPFPRLPSARALRSHARSHSPRRAFACAQCDHAYKFKQSLNHHVKNAHGVKAVRLPPLPAPFPRLPSARALRSHARSHSPRRAFACAQCDHAYKFKQSLNHHVKNAHGVKAVRLPPLPAPFPRLPSARALRSHARSHSPRRAFACAQCDHAYKFKQSLNHHVKNAHGVKAVRLPPLPAPFPRLPSARALRSHARSHSPRRAFACAQCDHAYKFKQSLNHHVKNAHGVKAVRLPPLPAPFPRLPSARALRSHARSHSPRRAFACAQCDHAYKFKQSLNHHVKNAHGVKAVRLPPLPAPFPRLPSARALRSHARSHSPRRAFACAQCDHAYKFKQSLNHHVKNAHGVKAVRLPPLPAPFPRLPSARALRSHARSHSPRRAFACAQCDHAYKFKQSLNHHVKNAHGVKAVRLPPLPAPFPRLPSARALRSHARSHSPRRAFACAQCDHAYKFKQSLNHHVKNAHGVKAVRLPPLPAPFPRLPSARALRSHARSHSPRRAFACAQCDHAYKFKQSLNHHVKNAHGVKAVRLPPLPAPFPRLPSARALRSHARSHSPRRAFACAQCDHAYKFKQSLNHHVKNAHGVKAVRLPPLPAPFPRLPSARALRSHARSHSPRRAFACAQCDHAYKFKQSLNHHVKNAHGVKAKTAIRPNTGSNPTMSAVTCAT